MRKISKYVGFALVAVLLVLPWALFNFDQDAVSQRENRPLAEMPAPGNASFDAWQAYINDRIGLREQALTANDMARYWLKMGPSGGFEGKDDELFYTDMGTVDSEFLQAYSDMLLHMQQYCLDRGVPFLYVLAPSKYEVYSDKLPDGYEKGERHDSRELQKLLDQKKVRYINLYPQLEQLHKKVRVYGKGWDINHWNDTGALYGTNLIADELSKDFPKIHRNSFDDFTKSEESPQYVIGTKYPIHETVSILKPKAIDQWTMDQLYVGDVRTNYQHRGTLHVVNPTSSGPRALVFHGSYYGGGERNKFFQPFFSESFNIHNYENAMDLPYYFNIAKPDVVLFTQATYTLTREYFNFDKLKTLQFNKPLSLETAEKIEPEKATTQAKAKVGDNNLVHMCIPQSGIDKDTNFAWMIADNQVYDLSQREWGYNLRDDNGASELSADDAKQQCWIADLPLTDMYDGHLSMTSANPYATLKPKNISVVGVTSDNNYKKWKVELPPLNNN